MDLAYQFNSYLYMSEFANICGDILKDDLGKMLLPDGTEVDTPAIYIADQQIPDANLPRITITYLFDKPRGADLARTGIEELTDPTTGQSIFVPYYETYIQWQILLDCLSSSTRTHLDSNGKLVNTPTANNILTKLRKSFLIERNRRRINTQMSSTLQPFSVTDLRDSKDEVFQTEIMKESTLLVTFDTRDRIYDFEGGWFNAIEYEGILKRHKDDLNPIPVNGSAFDDTPLLKAVLEEYRYANYTLPQQLKL